jgi:hypothetical protein
MAVKVFSSDDAGAPVLTGAAGSLITLLDKCLVDGYVGKPSLGWSKLEDSTSTLAAYRHSSGSRRYLRVDNSSSYNTDRGTVLVRGFESMTGIAVGDGLFPVNEQVSGGLTWWTSIDLTTARPWILIGDGKFFYLQIKHGYGGAGKALMCFGEYISYKAGDVYNQIITGHNAEIDDNEGGAYPTFTSFMAPQDGIVTGGGCYGARAYHQLGGSVGMALPFDGFQFTQVGPGQPPAAPYSDFTNPSNGELYFGKYYVSDRVSLRGEMPGLWAPLFDCGSYFNDGDLVVGSGELAGRTLKLIASRCEVESKTYWQAIEVSDTWYI